VPLFGEIILKSIMSRFARVLAALINAGIPITVSLEIGRRVAENQIVEREIARMAEGIVDGKGVTGSLEGSTVFPPLVVKMLAVGEETGTMDKMLLKVSSYFDRDVEYAVKNLTQAIEPILLVIMGVAVLFIALAIFLPMWNLMQAMTH
jgi:type II secretory pathway component PulF